MPRRRLSVNRLAEPEEERNEALHDRHHRRRLTAGDADRDPVCACRPARVDDSRVDLRARRVLGGSYNFEQARFEFLGANLGQIVARCNITNPLDGLNGESVNPSWNCMSITYDDPDGLFAQYRVRVQLRLANGTDGASATITTFDSNLVADSNPEVHGFVHAFNFPRNAYYLTVILDRANALS